MTPEERAALSHFVRIVFPIRRAERIGGLPRVQALLGSEKFTAAFASNIVALPPADRVRALGIVSEVMGAPAPIRRDERFPAPRRPIKWTELNKARFRKAWLQGGPEAGARAVGISYKAARIAAKRQGLTVVPATSNVSMAA